MRTLSAVPAMQPTGINSLAAGVDNDHEIHFEADVARDRQSLFLALMLPEYIEMWAPRPQCSSTVAAVDGEEGSVFKLCSVRSGRVEYQVDGRHTLVDVPSRIESAWSFRCRDQEWRSRIRFTLESKEIGTRLVISQVGIADENHRLLQKEWWESALKRFERFFSAPQK